MQALLRVVLGAALVLGLVFAGPAFAGGKAQEKINQLTVKTQEFRDHALKGLVTREVGTLQAWLGEAQAYLAQEEEDLLKLAINRAELQVRLIEAMLARGGAEAAAKKAHEQTDAREKEVLKLRNEAFKLEERQAALEKQGL